MRRPTARDYKDASRVALIMGLLTAAASFTYKMAGVPPVPPTKGTWKTIALRDLSWILVTAVVLLIPRLGETGTKCFERLVGTAIGGGAGLLAALAHSAPVATLVAALTGAAGELLGSAGRYAYAGKMVSVTFAVVAMPSFGSFGLPRSREVDAAVIKLALERMAAVVIGVGLVYLASVVWFPRAASEEAFVFAEDTVRALRDMAAVSFHPAVLMCGDGEDDRGGRTENKLPLGALAAATTPRTPAAKAAYLDRLVTRSLAPTTDAAVRAAHIADCESRLQAAAVARGRLKTALDVARKEVVVGRLPFMSIDGCRMPCRRPGAVKADDAMVAAAASALPTPAADPPPPRRAIAWRPVYIPTLSMTDASWIRRLAPRAFARRALPAAQLADVGAACGAVGRALWISGDAAGGGFPRYMSDLVKERYGNGVVPTVTAASTVSRLGARLTNAKSAPQARPSSADAAASAAAQAAERVEAAGVVEDLAALVGDCLTEALGALALARQTYLDGAVPPGAPRAGVPAKAAAAAGPATPSAAAVRARWPALRRLQDAQIAISERRCAFDQAEEATLHAVERLHERRASKQQQQAGGEGAGDGGGSQPPSPLSPASLPPLPPVRLPNTLEATAVRIRWLALLFGFSECRRGLEELAAAVEALRDACEAAVGGGGRGGGQSPAARFDS